MLELLRLGRENGLVCQLPLGMEHGQLPHSTQTPNPKANSSEPVS